MPRGVSALDEARLQGRLWTPSVLIPSLWFDAADISTTIISGSTVTQWNDKSGNNRNITVVGSAPSIALSSLNALNTVAFDNRTVTQVLEANYSYSGADITIVSLARSVRAGGRTNFSRLWSMNATGQADFATASGLLMLYGVGTANNASMFRNFAVIAQSPTNTDGQWAFHVGTKSGGSGTFSSNGQARTTGATSNTPFGFNQFRFGNDTNQSDSGLFGNIAEAFMFPYAATQKDEWLITGYLAHKWGLTANLPASHPFANRPPLIGD
jgi:hypothetical protein